MKKIPHSKTRRKLLKNSVIVGMAGTAGVFRSLTTQDDHPRRSSVIVEENRKTGTTDWQLTYVRSDQYRSKVIEGYCSATSVGVGEEIGIFVSTQPASEVSIDIYRMGYYGGKGGRHMGTYGPFATETQPTPAVGKNRLRECKWKVTSRIRIPEGWVSGVYLGKLSCKAHRYQSYVIFVVRDNRKADILLQTSDTTWQAYNKWPDQYSLYDTDPPVRVWSATTWVSYDRPYGWYPQVVDQPLSQGSGEFLLWEYPMCYWLEQNGYDVTYGSNIDTHNGKAGLDRIRCFLSVGHDEYWSTEMYERIQTAIGNGLNVAFLNGDSVVATIPLHQLNEEGRPYRIVRRTGMFGGISEEDRQLYRNVKGWALDVLHEKWEKHGPSQALLVGGRTTYPGNGSGDWTLVNDKHWLLQGTGMKNGEVIPGLVGWEYHSEPPTGVPGLEVIASGLVYRGDGSSSPYAATIYPGPKGNWVFNASTIYWSLGLASPPGVTLPFSHLGRPHGVDARVQQITANFLKRSLE
ncbi:N,N-dimethylformamidase beta subunit family domain-containing protein [Ravibacter arvi]|uniref:N,N-dimethylformamidase beta subunit family domain-containing protein n=1 Tax=Ravibacter arvi TaxID=2051041 RepID=UPI0031F12896